MKKQKLVLIIALLLCFAQGRAQNYWDFGGNTNLTGDGYLGSLNSDGYNTRFYTNATEKMRLMSGGNLGIGTTNPTSILSIDGNSARTIQLERHTTANTAGNNLTLLSGGATSGATNKDGGTLFLNSGTATGTGSSIMQFSTATAGSTGTSDNSPSVKMTILGNGNVGIGITAPTNLLHVYGGNFQMTNSSTLSTSTDGFQIMLNGLAAEIRQRENSDMTFFTNDIQRMIIESGGKVGISTGNPSRQLDVKQSSGSAQLRLTYTTNSAYTDFTNNSSGYLVIEPTGSRTGINETSPTNTLDVNGGIQMTYPAGNSTTVNDFVVIDGSGNLLRRNVSVIGAGGVNACGGGLTTSFVPVVSNGGTSEICNSQIYDNGTNVGIGAGNAPDVNYETDIEAGSLYGLLINSEDLGATINVTGTTAAATTAGIQAINTMSSSGSANYGVYTSASGCSSANTGIQATATGGTGATAGYFQASDASIGNTGVYGRVFNNTGSTNLGVDGYNNVEVNSSTNYGVRGVVGNTATNCTDYGVYGLANGGSGSTDYAGYFNGRLYAATYLNLPSDENLKSNINSFNDALANIDLLNPVTYNYNTTDYPQMSLPDNLQYGFLAQELEDVYPEMVGDAVEPAVLDANGDEVYPAVNFKTVKVGELMPVAIEGIKELKAIVEDQQAQITALQSQLDGCCGGGNRVINPGNDGTDPNHQTIELSSIEQSPSLGDCLPNPNQGQCSVPYFIPYVGVSKAEITFYDQSGHVVSSVEISGRGQGQLTVLASNLADGMYQYSLIVDGKVIDTKKMVKAHQ